MPFIYLQGHLLRSRRGRVEAQATNLGSKDISMSLLKDFALTGQDGGNRGQRRRCARGELCPTITQP